MISHKMNLLDYLVMDIKMGVKEQSESVCHEPAIPTIKDFTGIQGACKTEMKIVAGKPYITFVSGDCEAVFGLAKTQLIGQNVYEILNLKPSYIKKIWHQLQSKGFCFKTNIINGRQVFSFLMMRDKNSLVEISINQPPI
jgi:hypothetical protein